MFGYIFDRIQAPLHHVLLLQLIDASQYEFFTLDLNAHLVGPIVQIIHELIVFIFSLLDFFESQRTHPEQLFSYGVID